MSKIGLGAWQCGGDWGDAGQADALAVLSAVDAGVTLFDIADVYGDGRRESIMAEFLAGRPGRAIMVAAAARQSESDLA